MVETFLRCMPVGSVGLDIGCGNGKYLAVNPDVFIVGSDRSVLAKNPTPFSDALLLGWGRQMADCSRHRSSNLIGITHSRKVQDSLVADALDLPHPESRFDFAICIAVIHHFSSLERRCKALECILATLKAPSKDGSGGGRALIYVWALEQKNSRRGWDEGDQQDVFVPWVMSEQFSASKGKGGEQNRQVSKSRKTSLGEKGGTTSDEGTVDAGSGKMTHQRYYHLYRRGELEADIIRAGGTVLECGQERDNWWAICCVSGEGQEVARACMHDN